MNKNFLHTLNEFNYFTKLIISSANRRTKIPTAFEKCKKKRVVQANIADVQFKNEGDAVNCFFFFV